MHERCNFCTITDESERIIKRGKLATSFLSRPRLAPGHALVVPNRHVLLPHELTDAEVLAVQREADRLSRKMLGLFALGVDKWQKMRPYVLEGTGVKMDHMHTHVLPSVPGNRLYADGIHWGDKDSWQDVNDAERDEMIGLLSE